MPNWRNVSAIWRHDAIINMMSRLSHRYSSGLAKHGPRFNGDPVAHLEEELFDALFYLQVIMNRVSLCSECREAFLEDDRAPFQKEELRDWLQKAYEAGGSSAAQDGDSDDQTD